MIAASMMLDKLKTTHHRIAAQLSYGIDIFLIERDFNQCGEMCI